MVDNDLNVRQTKMTSSQALEKLKDWVKENLEDQNVPFERVTWQNGQGESINQSNLNRFERALDFLLRKNRTPEEDNIFSTTDGFIAELLRYLENNTVAVDAKIDALSDDVFNTSLVIFGGSAPISSVENNEE